MRRPGFGGTFVIGLGVALLVGFALIAAISALFGPS